jgi:hypothetical protein
MYQKHSLQLSAGIALTLLVLADTSARADLISWGYNWEPSSTKVVANGGGSGYLAVTDEPANTAAGSSNTVVTNIHAVSTAPYNTPDMFSHTAISFVLQLKDIPSKATATVTFTGYFSGMITGNSSNIQLTITSPKTDTVTLGGNTYSVAIGNYTPPGPSGATNAGSLNAFVTVTPGNGGGGVVSGVPEPSTAMLAGLALPCLGWFQWRKRRIHKANKPRA